MKTFIPKPFGFYWQIGLVVLLLATFAASPVFAQPADSAIYYPDRTLLVGGAGAVIGVGTLTGLTVLWYKDHEKAPFHFFNDNNDWLQMDKAGHAMTAYYMGRMGIRALQWTGTDFKKSVWIGGLYGFAYLSAIEVLDGFSAGYGFSTGDVLANAAGSALVIGQELAWADQRAQLKFSAHLSGYAKYRPELLGSNTIERFLKDYNGQTYWLSVNGAAWFDEKPTWLPTWLNLALGYGADGMTGGSVNPPFNSSGIPIPHFERNRQFYLSLDVDLTRIQTRSKVLKTVFELFSFVKIPAPALEIRSDGAVRGHWLYF